MLRSTNGNGLSFPRRGMVARRPIGQKGTPTTPKERKPTPPPACGQARGASDESFATTLTRAKECRAETWADQMVDIADELGDGEPSHEDIGVARLQVHSRDRLIGAYNARYRQDKGGVQVNVGLQVTLTAAEHAKLLARWEQAQLANSSTQSTFHRQT